MKLIAGNSHPELAQAIAKNLGVELVKAQISRFADGEIQIEIHESIRGHDVFIIQSTCPPVNENYMELFILADALRRASPRSLVAVVPYYGYARQDRKVAPRAPITAKLMADLLVASGINRLVCVDLHAGQIQGFFNIPVDHLYGLTVLAPILKEELGDLRQVTVVSPDAGGLERARLLARKLECPLAIVDKRRLHPNQAEAVNLIGEVQERRCVIVDDIIDTAGTLTQAVDILLKHGAKEVFAVGTHGVLSGSAIDRLKQSPLQRLYVSDSVPVGHKVGALGSKVRVVSLAPLLAQAIHRVFSQQSMSALFD